MKTPLWHGAELASLFEQESFAADVTGISIDTRTLQPGDLFVALSGDPGPRFGGGEPNARDGHDFVAQAIAAGAAGVMVHRDMNLEVPVLRVSDTLDGLWQLGQCARLRFQGRVVALTGSSGKTTLRSWFEHVLRNAGSCHASTGSLNNHWGVPLSLARMPYDRDYAVLEVGTNHPGEIAPLSELVSPDVSVLLNVLPAHIGNFENLDALTEEKLSIASGLNDDGLLVLPQSLKSRSPWPRTLTFGDADADVWAEAEAKGAGTSLQINVNGERFNASLPFLGKERVQSALALVAALRALAVDLGQVLPALLDLPLPIGRGNVTEKAGVVIVDDSYNANPGSMAMSLHSFAMLKARRKIAFLGEMLELGAETERYHQDMAAQASGLDQVYSFGQGFSGCHFASPSVHHSNVSEFPLESFVAELREGDAVLVKGSNKVFWQRDFVQKLIGSLEG